MRVLKRDPVTKLPIEVLLTDVETPLFQWYLQIRETGVNGYDAWDLLTCDDTVSDRQYDALERDTFFRFLTSEIPRAGVSEKRRKRR